jgi:hypothetical protein
VLLLRQMSPALAFHAGLGGAEDQMEPLADPAGGAVRDLVVAAGGTRRS